jgi:hypothetical protein
MSKVTLPPSMEDGVELSTAVSSAHLIPLEAREEFVCNVLCGFHLGDMLGFGSSAGDTCP